MGFIPCTKSWFNIQKSFNATNHINSLKKKKSSDHINWWWKVFVKIQTLFRIKSLSKLGIKGSSLNYKEHIQKPTANIILNDDRASYLIVETEFFAQGNTVHPCWPQERSFSPVHSPPSGPSSERWSSPREKFVLLQQGSKALGPQSPCLLVWQDEWQEISLGQMQNLFTWAASTPTLAPLPTRILSSTAFLLWTSSRSAPCRLNTLIFLSERKWMSKEDVC